VFLKGCVRTKEHDQAVGAVGALPCVERVIDELMVGTRGKPPYPGAAPLTPAPGYSSSPLGCGNTSSGPAWIDRKYRARGTSPHNARTRSSTR
jgi:hypothetical protein